jgi:hypothetical protein
VDFPSPVSPVNEFEQNALETFGILTDDHEGEIKSSLHSFAVHLFGQTRKSHVLIIIL